VGRELYYGSLSDPYVAHMQIVNAKEFKDLHMSDKIVVMLLKTDPSVAPKDRIAKRTESHGLFRAVDVAEVWLNRYVK
jgi:hypothetical protein